MTLRIACALGFWVLAATGADAQMAAGEGFPNNAEGCAISLEFHGYMSRAEGLLACQRYTEETRWCAERFCFQRLHILSFPHVLAACEGKTEDAIQCAQSKMFFSDAQFDRAIGSCARRYPSRLPQGVVRFEGI